MKPTKNLLNKIEDLFAETDYVLRYEKGSFKSGYCILKSTKVVVVNKYYSVEGKINSLTEILRQLKPDIDVSKLSEKNQSLLEQLLAQ
ncbi:hypothetical protein V6R21_31435 [Limibacter armeniacum]|uniref:hypothetical protein n=1 Tax=Limibacter armeniacum TaxID=466084 RepID=UPI002FE4FFC5